MNQDAKVTVIVPVYNTQEYLGRCINSILRQTYGNIELILINDGSTDDSAKICDEYSQKDARVFVIHQKNKGVSVARNQGLEITTGDYIVFVDSDDWIDYNYIATLIKNIANPSKELLMTGCSYVYKTHIEKKTYGSGIFPLKDALADKIISRNNFITSKLFYAKIIKSHKIRFKEGICYGEDWIFGMEYMKNISYVKVVLDCGYMYNRDLINPSLVARHFNFRQYFETFEYATKCISYIYGYFPDPRKEALESFIASVYLFSAIKSMYRKDSLMPRMQRIKNLQMITSMYPHYVSFIGEKLLNRNQLYLFDFYYFIIFKLRYSLLQPFWNFYVRIKSR